MKVTILAFENCYVAAHDKDGNLVIIDFLNADMVKAYDGYDNYHILSVDFVKENGIPSKIIISDSIYDK